MGIEACYIGENQNFSLEGIITLTRKKLEELKNEQDDLKKQEPLFIGLGTLLIEGDLEESINLKNGEVLKKAQDKISELKDKGCDISERDLLSIALNFVFGKLNDDKKIMISKYFYLFNVTYLSNYKDFVIKKYKSESNNVDNNDNGHVFLSEIVRNYYGDTNYLLEIFDELGVNRKIFYQSLISPLRAKEDKLIELMVSRYGLTADIQKYIESRKIPMKINI